jgi:competence protein ComEA
MTLKGIGQSRAEDIIKYRTENGPFGAIEEIMQVSGIKTAVFEKIRDDITVGQSQ